MSQAVGNNGLQRHRLAERVQDEVSYLFHTRLHPTPDVVGRTSTTAKDDQLDGPAMVVYVQPLALVLG